MNDYTLRFPDPILDYYADHPEEKDNPVNTVVDEGFVAEIKNKHFFIQARVTIPLHDIDNGVGFGLWVEIDQASYDTYLEVIDDNEKYKDFMTIGSLANEWPGFENTFGLKVKIRCVRVDEKIYITELLEEPKDIALVGALRLDATNTTALDALRQMVESSNT